MGPRMERTVNGLSLAGFGLLALSLLLLGAPHGVTHGHGSSCALCAPAALDVGGPPGAPLSVRPDAGRTHPFAPLPAHGEALAAFAGRGPPSGLR